MQLLRRSLALCALCVASLACAGAPGPRVEVAIDRPGADPETVEAVMSPIEAALRGAPGVTGVRIASAVDRGTAEVDFASGTDANEALLAARDAVAGARDALPEDAAPQLRAVTEDARWEFAVPPDRADALVERLQRTSGVREVRALGADPARVEIRIDPDRAAALGVSPEQVLAALREASAGLGPPALEVSALGALQVTAAVRVSDLAVARATPPPTGAWRGDAPIALVEARVDPTASPPALDGLGATRVDTWPALRVLADDGALDLARALAGSTEGAIVAHGPDDTRLLLPDERAVGAVATPPGARLVRVTAWSHAVWISGERNPRAEAELVEAIAKQPDVAGALALSSSARSTVTVQVDRERLAAHGLTAGDAAQALALAAGVRVGELLVVVDGRATIGTPSGARVPVDAVATRSTAAHAPRVRVDGQPGLRIDVWCASGPGCVQADALPLPAGWTATVR